MFSNTLSVKEDTEGLKWREWKSTSSDCVIDPYEVNDLVISKQDFCL